MATQKKDPLEFKIVDVPPELYFYFAHASGKSISLTLETFNGAAKDLEVWIDCLDIPSNYVKKSKEICGKSEDVFTGMGGIAIRDFPTVTIGN